MKYRRNASTLIIILTAATTFAAADYSYAAEGSDGGSCTTDQRTPKEISTYVKNLADALREIRATAKANPWCTNPNRDGAGIENDARNLKDRAVGAAEQLSQDVLASVNEDIAFSNFSNSAQFYLSMILDDEIPKGTERDNRLLKKQQKSINDAQKAIAAACAASVVLPEGKVPGIPSGTTLSDALNLITNNHVRTVNFFRAVAIKNESSGDFEKSFILTGDDTAFRAAVRANYAQKAANDCRVSGDFFKNISAAMDRIGSLGGKIGEAIADWEEAWDMLNNASAPKGSNALKLSFGMGGEGDTGFSMGADLAAEQSAKYDNPPEALGVGAQLRSIGQKIVSTMESIAPQYLPVEQAIKNAEHTEEVPPLVRKITEARAFDTDVATQYKTLEALIGEAKETTQTNVTELVKMHATLVNLANAIGKAVPVSEKACDDQSTGKGTCEYRK